MSQGDDDEGEKDNVETEEKREGTAVVDETGAQEKHEKSTGREKKTEKEEMANTKVDEVILELNSTAETGAVTVVEGVPVEKNNGKAGAGEENKNLDDDHTMGRGEEEEAAVAADTNAEREEEKKTMGKEEGMPDVEMVVESNGTSRGKRTGVEDVKEEEEVKTIKKEVTVKGYTKGKRKGKVGAQHSPKQTFL